MNYRWGPSIEGLSFHQSILLGRVSVASARPSLCSANEDGLPRALRAGVFRIRMRGNDNVAALPAREKVPGPTLRAPAC